MDKLPSASQFGIHAHLVGEWLAISLLFLTACSAPEMKPSASPSVSVAAPAEVASGYFVAPGGNDSSDGSAATPFATLGRAQAAMRQSPLKICFIYSGTYYLTSPLQLTSLDNGETWQALPRGVVVLSGGVAIAGWRNEGNGIYSAASPVPVGLDLSIDSKRQLPARRGYDMAQPFTSGWNIIPPAQGVTAQGNLVSVLPTDMTPSVKPGAIFQAMNPYYWFDSFTRITNVDTADNVIELADEIPLNEVPGQAGSWRVLMDPADLSGPGQFAYDQSSSTLYLEPEAGQNPNGTTVVASQLITLLCLDDVSNVTFSGITFADTLSDLGEYSGEFSDMLAAVVGSDVTGLTLAGDSFLNVGNGISLRGSSNNTITGNTFEQLGGAGIMLAYGSDYNLVTRNTMRGLSMVNASATGIHILASSYNTVDSNSINGTGRWGVDLYPVDQNSLQGNVISNNVILNTSQQTNDTGAVYSYADAYGNGDYLNESVTITGNRIENVGGILRDSAGNFQKGSSQGIYMDDQVGGATITKNVIETGSGTGIMLCHGCQGNVADNNVIILQSAAFYDRGKIGLARSTGAMAYNGVTRVDLLPSYFPSKLALSTIVVGLSGTLYDGVAPAFTVLADGVPVGSGVASNAVNHYEFLAPLAPHQIHTIGIQLTNGADQGPPKAGLQNITLFVNGTGVQIADPRLIMNNLGSFGFLAGNDSLPPTNISFTHNIVYQNAGTSTTETDWADWCLPGYLDRNPGEIDFNILSPGVSKATDAIFGNTPLEAHSLVSVDPAFVNPAIGDYTLQSKSPAPGVGFHASGVPLAP